MNDLVRATVPHFVRLDWMVAAVPHRIPLVIKRVQSNCDRLSAERSFPVLVLGWNAAEFGLGSNEFDGMRKVHPEVLVRQAAIDKAVATVRGVWSPEPFSFPGADIRAVDAQSEPLQKKDGVPLVIAGGGHKTPGHLMCLGDVSNLGPGPVGSGIPRRVPAVGSRFPKPGLRWTSI